MLINSNMPANSEGMKFASGVLSSSTTVIDFDFPPKFVIALYNEAIFFITENTKAAYQNNDTTKLYDSTANLNGNRLTINKTEGIKYYFAFG